MALRALSRFCFALALVLSFALPPTLAAAQPPAESPPAAVPAPAAPAPTEPSSTEPSSTEPASAELPQELRQDIQKLVSTLKDDAQRDTFVRNLETLVAVGEPAAAQRDDWLSLATTALGGVSGSVLALARDIATLPDSAGQLLAELSDPTVVENATRAGVMVVAVLVAALAAEALVQLVLWRPRRLVETRESRHLLGRAGWLALLTLLDVLPIVAFAVVASAVLAFVDLTFLVRLAVVAVINANVMARILVAAGRAVLAPRTPQLRLVPLDSEKAAYGLIWLRRFTVVGVYGSFLLRAAWILGLPSAVYIVLMDALGLVLAGMALVFILQIRRPVAAWLRQSGGASGQLVPLRRRIANIWHLVAIAYVVTVYVVWATDIAGGLAFIGQATALSALALLAARLSLIALHRGFDAVFRLNDEVRAEFPTLEARANRYLPILRQGASLLVGTVTALLLLEIWGAAPFAWLATGEGQDLLGRAISILIVLVGGFIAWELWLAFTQRLYDGNPGSTRLKTLLPFLQNGFRIVLITIAGLMVLSELGVNIAPLLAGAGVLGLAIGFGAQTMVKDVITGIFILMEDTLSVGDVVEFGNHSGLVEKITIRTVHLRDFDGNLHAMPFGEMQVVKNMSKQFAYAVVDVRVSYREDVDEALAVMAQVADDMSATGPLAETIIGPFELMGVEGLENSAVWLRGRFKTRPLGQWNVRREFYRRIKAAFDARGIEIPYPHQTIYFGTDKKGEAPPLHLARAAGPRRPAPKAARAEAERAAHRPGPVVEEHPGARERPAEQIAEAPVLEEASAGGDPVRPTGTAPRHGAG